MYESHITSFIWSQTEVHETAINAKNIALISKQRFHFGAVKLQQAIDQSSSLFNPLPEVLETIQEEIAAWKPDTSRILLVRKKYLFC